MFDGKSKCQCCNALKDEVLHLRKIVDRLMGLNESLPDPDEDDNDKDDGDDRDDPEDTLDNFVKRGAGIAESIPYGEG